MSVRHYAVVVGDDLGGDGSPAAAFDQAGCVEAVERVGDASVCCVSLASKASHSSSSEIGRWPSLARTSRDSTALLWWRSSAEAGSLPWVISGERTAERVAVTRSFQRLDEPAGAQAFEADRDVAGGGDLAFDLGF